MNGDTAAPHWFRLEGDIRVMAFERVDTVNRHPDRTLSEWVLVMVSRGERTFRIYGTDYAVHSDEYFLLPPHVSHEGLRVDAHRAYFFHFTMRGGEVAAPSVIRPEEILLPLYGRLPIELHCFDILDSVFRFRTQPFFSEALLSSQLRTLLLQFSLHMQKSALWTKGDDAAAYRILRYIEENMEYGVQAQAYTSVFGKSYRQLNTLFQRVYGTTIKQMQLTLRMNRAKQMLSMGYSIAETGRACGFTDYLYFLKAFKSAVGVTPTEFSSGSKQDGI